MTSESAQEQFERMLKPHALDCYKTAYRLTGSQADAEDLVQELFIKLYQQFDQWRGMESPSGWITRVLYNLHIDCYRKKARTHGINARTYSSEEQPLDELVSAQPSPVDETENSQRQKRIRAALDQLDVEQRVLVTLHLLEGHTLEEIAILLDSPLGTLKSRLHRCKAKLKGVLKLQPFSKN